MDNNNKRTAFVKDVCVVSKVKNLFKLHDVSYRFEWRWLDVFDVTKCYFECKMWFLLI